MFNLFGLSSKVSDTKSAEKEDIIFRRNAQVPYVVVIGDCGVGKSTLVEKVTGVSGLSSNVDMSATKSSETFNVLDKSLLICDTPGLNSLDSKFTQNVWIAHAMNLFPVSSILIVVKAEIRFDTVIGAVRKQAESFIEFLDVLGVCVTHINTVTWKKEDFKKALMDELQIENVVFSGKKVSSHEIITEIQLTCGKPMDITINSKNFLSFFDIAKFDVSIVRSTGNEIAEIKMIKEKFFKELSKTVYTKDEKSDMICEFQHFMEDQIIEAQQKISKIHNFYFSEDDKGADDAGHIATLTNQLRAVLHEVRTRQLVYQAEHGASDLRKCPYCPCIWAKITGCSSTRCGKLVKTFDGKEVMHIFTFQRNGGDIKITKTGKNRIIRNQGKNGEYNVGCGAEIKWENMKSVRIPDEFNVDCEKAVNTADIKILPKWAQNSFDVIYDNKMKSVNLNSH